MIKISPSSFSSKFCKIELVIIFLITMHSISVNGQADKTLKNTLPESGKLVDDRPTGKGWINLLASVDEWNFENAYWQLNNNLLRGSIGKEKEHHYSYTKKSYRDFELTVLIKMVGDEDANSGVCVRINPTSWDDAPGYQVDMGKGYWGSLWEERKAGMVQKFPDSLAMKVAKKNDWNYYYIIAKGHRIQAWLNGVKTIDIVHDSGYADGKIGFQLCHMHNPTVVDVKSLYLRELK
jgi:hypothetical protein